MCFWPQHFFGDLDLWPLKKQVVKFGKILEKKKEKKKGKHTFQNQSRKQSAIFLENKSIWGYLQLQWESLYFLLHDTLPWQPIFTRTELFCMNRMYENYLNPFFWSLRFLYNHIVSKADSQKVRFSDAAIAAGWCVTLPLMIKALLCIIPRDWRVNADCTFRRRQHL